MSRSACMHIFLHVLAPPDRASSLLLCGLQTPQCAVTRLATTDAATAGENTASVSFPTLSGRKPDVYSRYYCVVVVVVFIDVATYLHPLLQLILDAGCTEHSEQPHTFLEHRYCRASTFKPPPRPDGTLTPPPPVPSSPLQAPPACV